jgi:NodT family efflux transporter outer membrane factor (OMF) lipoprotein
MNLSGKILRGATVAAALGGCAVGPDFHSPKPPATERYTREELPAQTAQAAGAGGEAQRFTAGADIPGEWWALFESPVLDKLIKRAIADNPSLAIAEATLRQARDNLRAERSRLLPGADASVSVTHERISGAEFGGVNSTVSTFTLYNASVNVSYTFDLFGGVRRDLESFQALVDYQDFQREAAYLTLTANVVTAAVTQAELRGQIDATHDILTLQEKGLQLIQDQFKLGGVSRADVLAQQTQIAQTRATLPPLEKQAAQTGHLLAALAGALPSEIDVPEFDLAAIKLPQELPVSLPSALVRQRPDIRASEALLHQASAQIGVATAAVYPQLTLTGSLGWEALSAAKLFGPNTLVDSLGAGLLQPLFHGGQLEARRDAALAAYDQANAQYRQTVLTAFQNVADALRALQDDARSLQVQSDALALAQQSLDLTQRQYKLQAVSYLTLLNAERQYQQTRLALVQAQAARLADTAALFQALGGGWWNRQPSQASATPAGAQP